MKIAVTGANSSVGKNLLARLIEEDDVEVIAGVRSEKAFATLPGSTKITPRTIDYNDGAKLDQALDGADCLVHLAGILIETKHSNYANSNVAATAAVVMAAQRLGISRIVFISVIGASADSPNAYFRSKGIGERLVADAGIPGTVIRTPILLGPGTAGADALRAAASRGQTKVLGGGYYQQRPLDIDDLNEAILNSCLAQDDGVSTHELVGPEPTAYRDLIQRAADLLGVKVEVGKVPIWLAKLGAGVTSTLKGGGMTPTVIDVITMNEEVQQNAADALGVSLTPLQITLEKCLLKT